MGRISVEMLYEVVAVSFLKIAEKVSMTVIPSDPSPELRKLLELRTFTLDALNSALEYILSGKPIRDAQGVLRKVLVVSGEKREEMVRHFLDAGFAEVRSRAEGSERT